jgi:probable phosphoglycerate mutase
VETGQVIAEALGLPGVEREDAFWELSKGDWEGAMPVDGVPPDIAQARAADPYGFRYPGGESLDDVAARAWPALQGWVRRNEGGPFLVFPFCFKIFLFQLLICIK